MSSAFLSLLNAGMTGMSQQPPDVILYTTSWEDYSTLHIQMRSLLRLKQSLLPPNKTATQRRGKQKEGKSYFASYVLIWSATPSPPPHRLFIGHSCLMNLFYEPIISIIISTETANFIQDSLPNVWLANINSEPCQQLRKVATVMNNLLINVNTEV